MTDWLHFAPLLIVLFIIASGIGQTAIKRREQRNRVVRPYVGETIYGRNKDS